MGWSPVQGSLPTDDGRAQGWGDGPGVCWRHNANLYSTRRECAAMAAAAGPKALALPFLLLREVFIRLSYSRGTREVSVNR